MFCCYFQSEETGHRDLMSVSLDDKPNQTKVHAILFKEGYAPLGANCFL